VAPFFPLPGYYRSRLPPASGHFDPGQELNDLCGGRPIRVSVRTDSANGKDDITQGVTQKVTVLQTATA
jgi:hypothetical protein